MGLLTNESETKKNELSSVGSFIELPKHNHQLNEEGQIVIQVDSASDDDDDAGSGFSNILPQKEINVQEMES